MKKLFISTLLFAAAMVVSSVEANILSTELNNSTVLTITPEAWTEIVTDTGIVPVPLEAGLDDRVDGEVVPYYRRLIALPAPVKPTVQIVNQQWNEWQEGLPPMGTEEFDSDRIPHLSSAGQVYIGEPYLWRRHWVSDLYIMPLKIEGDGVRTLQEMQVQVTYPHPERGLSRISDPLFETTVLNAESSRNWAVSSSLLPGRTVTNSEQSWPDGPMIRIEVTQEGIYQVTSEQLEASGIDLSGYDPRTFRIYGNGGLMLDEDPSEERDTFLRENAILVEGEEDGSWDENDRILFFAKSVNSWEKAVPSGNFRHTLNPYTRTNVYWLNIAEDGSFGKRMEDLESDEAKTFETNAARSRVFTENDVFIYYNQSYVETGKIWYDTQLSTGESVSRPFQLTAPLGTGDDVLWLAGKRLSSSGASTRAIVIINNVHIDTVSMSNSVQSIDIPPEVLVDGINTFTLNIYSGIVMLDWFEVHYMRTLQTTADRMDFDAFPEDGIAEVTLSGLENPYIFDVLDFDEVAITRNNPFVVNSSVTQPRRYIALEETAFLTPQSMRYDVNRGDEYTDGLRTPITADYIYIVHDDFYETAATLENYVEERDGVEVVRVLTSDIYDEFSWGVYDPTALRDFLMYVQANWTGTVGDIPSVCLLIGDGDYDYRNILSSSDRNWVPPYENRQECRDDWFAEFVENGDPEFIMGRLPVQSNYQLENYIERLMDYEANPDFGPWRSRFILVADDEWVESGPTSIDTYHISQAENLATHSIPSYMNINRIYIGTYPTNFDPVTSGRLKPHATRELIESINRGALMITWIGHGNAHVWAHEQLLVDTRDIGQINAGAREPIYIAGTCSWGHFDRPDNEAMFEQLLIRQGGAIGAIAASRNTSGISNYHFLQTFYSIFFNRQNPRSLGEALMLAKIQAQGVTNQYYHCFADPSMKTALPIKNMVVTDIAPDSLVAMEYASVFGEVREPGSGAPISGFDGEALVTVYDSYDTLAYQFTNSDGTPGRDFYYRMPGGSLFRGFQTVTSGILGTEDTEGVRFFVPRDATTGSSDGWIQLFAHDGETDALGSMVGVQISSVMGSTNDSNPPEISVYFDHEDWREGDLTSTSPVLMVGVADSSGVNLTGEIGHSIRAIINGSEEILLTDDFIYNRDSYTTGMASRKLYDLTPGWNTLEVWAWDNANNFTRDELSFYAVEVDEEVVLSNVVNAPNPFENETWFTFESVGAEEATVRIFTPSGRLIKTIGPETISGQFVAIPWDGRDHYGDAVANGVYLYRVRVSSSSGSDEKVGTLMRIR